jgi:galactokinase
MATPALSIDIIQKNALVEGFAAAFGGEPTRFFSAPGRTEIGGNHTDHQRGRVLAAAVNLDTVAAVRENGTDKIRILSEGYPMCEVDVKELTPREDEINTTPALIRGVAARFAQMGGLLAPGTDAGAWAEPHAVTSEYALLANLDTETGIAKLMEEF